LVAAGFTNVRRYQLGIPIWRALGRPTEIELERILRIFKVDHTAVFFDARTTEKFSKGSLLGTHNVPADALTSGGLQKAPLPANNLNTSIVIFGDDFNQAAHSLTHLASALGAMSLIFPVMIKSSKSSRVGANRG
jgi:rhodanese-related sulfurtransferase